MATVNTTHILAVPVGGLNFDQGGTIPAQVYRFRVLSTFGPWFLVDAIGNIDATNANFLDPNNPPTPNVKMKGMGEYSANDRDRTHTIDLQTGQRVAMKFAFDAGAPEKCEAPEVFDGSSLVRLMYVEVSADQPFEI